ncbi:MAG: phosphatase PAP2 family protein [Bacteroidia bacterium]
MIKKILLIFILFSATSVFCQGLDYRVLRSLNKNEMPCWDKTMKGFSSAVTPLSIAVPVGILTQGYIQKNDVMIRNGYKSAITIGLAMTLSTTLKYTIKRQRPYDKYPNDIVQRDHPSTFSFPSGHTTCAFATATAMSLSYKKWYVTIPSFAYAGLVGYSRIRLGVHYPSDVLGGIILGIGSGLLTWQIDKMVNKK